MRKREPSGFGGAPGGAKGAGGAPGGIGGIPAPSIGAVGRGTGFGWVPRASLVPSLSIDLAP
ncbi:hypothetical protein GCM10017687_07030 [Streptomyces echinatus]